MWVIFHKDNDIIGVSEDRETAESYAELFKGSVEKTDEITAKLVEHYQQTHATQYEFWFSELPNGYINYSGDTEKVVETDFTTYGCVLSEKTDKYKGLVVTIKVIADNKDEAWEYAKQELAEWKSRTNRT